MFQSRYRPFAPILVAYLIVASLYAVLIPAWEAPDEPAHYNYIRQLAAFNLPIMTDNDYDQTYQSNVVSSDFAPQFSIEPFSYEDYQPPLYYLVQTPVYWLFDGSIIAMRLFGVLMGGITTILAWLIFSRLASLAGWDDTIPLLAVAFFAFLPQHIAMQASINNDSLSELLIAAGLLLLINLIPEWQTTDTIKFFPQTKITRSLIIIMSMALLTKVTTYLLILVVGIAILTVFWRDWVSIVRKGFELFTVPFLVGCLWWGRNLRVYGWPDFLGIQAHDAAVIGQPTTAAWIAQFGLPETLRRFAQTSFRSFWGQFGWMEVVMPPWVYVVLGLFSAVVLVGFALQVRSKMLEVKSGRLASVSSPGFPLSTFHFLLSSLFLLNLALFLAYNLTYVQHQGRYLFASLVPISLAVAIGIWFFVGQNRRVHQLPWGHLTAAGLVGLNLLALFRYILPAL